MSKDKFDPTKMKSKPFVPHEVIAGQIMRNLNSEIATPLSVQKAHDRELVIVAGAPSLMDHLDEIKELSKQDNVDIVAVNGTHDILARNKIDFQYMIVVDPRIKHLKHVKRPIKAVEYWIASQCHPKVFETLKDNDVRIWHINNRKYELQLMAAWHTWKKEPFILAISGSTAGLSAWTIGYSQGYRTFHMFGFDSCLNDKGEHHAYANTIKDVTNFEVDGKPFKTTRWMVQQMQDFQVMFNLMRPACKLITYGEGMIQTAHASLERQYEKYPNIMPQTFITEHTLDRVLNNDI